MIPLLDSLRVNVVVPTYRRPRLLNRCLESLTAQQRPADRVLVVARSEDIDAHAVIESHIGTLPGLEWVSVSVPGVLAAMAAGVARSTGEILAFTDDDAAPRPDWVKRLVERFGDPTVGAVGGRDVISGQEGPPTADVGRLRRSGRLSGMHHLGIGRARDVDVLKGVNMAFRAQAFVLPAPGVLRGTGAQVGFEIVTCAWARRHGWRVVYDPAIQVDHEAGPRSDSDQRVRPAASAVADAAYNSVIGGSAIGKAALARHAAYGLAVGTRDRPGLVRALAAMVTGEPDVLRRLPPALAGRLAAICGLATRRLTFSGPVVQSAMELRGQTQERPRVTLVAHDIHDGGGMERAYAELVRALHSEFKITVVSTSLADDLRPLVKWHRVWVPRRPFLAKFILFFVRGGLAIRTVQSDLVHTLGAIVPNRADVATLQFCHAGARQALGALAPAGAPVLRRLNTSTSRWFALLAESWCYRPSRLRHFAPVSLGVGSEAQRHYSGIRSVTTPNGVDLERFAPDATTRVTLRSEFGVDDQVVALFVGGDWDRKGLAIAIEATVKARAGGAHVLLWIVGSGDQKRFERMATELKCREVIRFFGRRSDTERFYSAADVFVLPTSYEAFSLVLLEAAASGLPLVVPAVNGVAELVGKAEAGVIVERDPESVAVALGSLAADHDLRSTLGTEARRRASAFTWERSVASVTELYQSLLTGPHGLELPNR